MGEWSPLPLSARYWKLDYFATAGYRQAANLHNDVSLYVQITKDNCADNYFADLIASASTSASSTSLAIRRAGQPCRMPQDERIGDGAAFQGRYFRVYTSL
ncbi:hypothetical protein O988_06066 [Pseudogymnoascus sp. VKM F-3808]|nr:hypothetical protein O988_06066 [Pseudogymnoascus sp. VKM F-3808]